jgi:hypothetical protein
MERSVPLMVQMAFETQLGIISQAGIADLANGTRWRIAPWDLPRAREWVIGASVALARNDLGKLWAFKMTNADNGEQVAVGRAIQRQGTTKPPRRWG